MIFLMPYKIIDFCLPSVPDNCPSVYTNIFEKDISDELARELLSRRIQIIDRSFSFFKGTDAPLTLHFYSKKHSLYFMSSVKGDNNKDGSEFLSVSLSWEKELLTIIRQGCRSRSMSECKSPYSTSSIVPYYESSQSERRQAWTQESSINQILSQPINGGKPEIEKLTSKGSQPTLTD